MARVTLNNIDTPVTAQQCSRFERMVFVDSQAQVPFPAWFNPARDMIYFSGCGGGGGAGGSTASSTGIGGGSAATAIRHPVVPWPGLTALILTVGAAGIGGATAVNGGAGGSTVLYGDTTAQSIVTLAGGGGGLHASETGVSGGNGGQVSLFNQSFNSVRSASNTTLLSQARIVAHLRAHLHQQPVTLRGGKSAARATVTSGSVGSFDPTTLLNLPAGNVFGNFQSLNGFGYGAPRCPSRVPTRGQNGGPGIAIIEFVEGLR